MTQDFVNWLNANAGAITVLGAIVTACATVILTATAITYAWQTWQLTKENRLLRKAGTDPEIVAYIGLNPRVWGAFDFIIVYVGKGAAQNISFAGVSGGELQAKQNQRN